MENTTPTPESDSTSTSTAPADGYPAAAEVRPTAKPVSARKLAANRANAARSTGPRTEEGKARSCMNAVRHGLAARACLLPGENAEELAALAAEMEADLRPSGAAQRELVGRIVSLSWRLRRLAGAEQELWEHEEKQAVQAWKQMKQQTARVTMPSDPFWRSRESHRPPPPATGGQFVARQLIRTRGGTSALERLAVYEQRLERALHAAFRQLQQLRKMQREEGQPEDAVDERTAPHGAALPQAIVQNEATEGLDEHSNVPGNVGMSGEDEAPIGDAPATTQNEPTVDPKGHETACDAQANAAATGGAASCSVQNEATAIGRSCAPRPPAA